jgi:hypothetical protein
LPRGRKRETRVAFIESLSGAMGYSVAVIFRGGWIDGIIAGRLLGADAMEKWLEGSVYFKELNGIAIGSGMAQALGPETLREVEEWALEKKKTLMPLGRRNREQASVIIDGLKDAIRGKS